MSLCLRACAAASTALLLAACQGVQTALGGDGAESAKFATLFTIFLIVTGTVYVMVIGFLIAAIVRRRREQTHAVESGTHHESHPLLRPALAGWGALIVIGLSVLGIASFVTDSSLARPAREPQLSIEITGQQWWWNVEYLGSNPTQNLRTANELHLPVGVPVHIRLNSIDVIHSFWVPNLAGKQDLIPGRTNDIVFVPRRTGLFRGQCAEFCGTQHTNMALTVTVESRADFERWWAAQLQPAQPPRTPEALAGFRYVTTRECSVCHTIAGTDAGGKVGPDLTHVASRRTIAAGAMPMSEGNLYGWIADPQSQKPGTKMPTIGLNSQELHAVVTYLKGLK